jgi:hypothetical protein
MSGKDVLILGAGFSCAVNGEMPITDRLGNEAIVAAGLTDDPRVPRRSFSKTFTFENWMSLIADEQPYLSEADNLYNQALFADLRSALATVLRTYEWRSIEAEAPPWLYELLTILHHRRATVITLNYDTLVEVGVASLALQLLESNAQDPITVKDILHDSPPLSLFYGGGGPIQPTFRLLKLHGSLDWWAAVRDTNAATLIRTRLLSRFGNPMPESEDDLERQTSGREVFIVPPATAKTSYYQNTFTRGLWSSAFHALRTADRISLLGYSLPVADLVMSGMIESAVRGRDVAIDVVNLKPKRLSRRIRTFGDVKVNQIGGSTCVSDFTREYRDRAGDAVIRELASIDPGDHRSARLLTRHSQRDSIMQYVHIQEIRMEREGVLVLVAGQVARMDEILSGQPPEEEGHAAGPYPNLSDLIALMQNTKRLVVRRDGEDSVVVGYSRLIHQMIRGDWFVAIPV